MPGSLDLSNLDLWYKVFHEEFDPERVYKPIAHLDYGETAWAQLLFINERGMTYAVVTYKTLCVNAEEFSRSASTSELALERARPRGRNSDIDEMDRRSSRATPMAAAG